MMIIYDNKDSDNDDDKNKSDNDENDDDNSDYNLPVDSPHKGTIMLSFDVSFVESKNNSQVSGDLRRHVPHVMSLWCDIFIQHHRICIVESSYE